MEEAYTALYQEFLRLQSLCLKQAAMLQHLTEALRRQQGLAPLSNGDLEDLVSTSWGTNNNETLPCPGVPTQAARTPLAIMPITRGNASACPIAGALDGLQLDPTDSPPQQRAQQPSIVEELRLAEQRGHRSQPARQTRRPWSSSFLNSEMLSEAGGLLMSRVTLQSQVCEFCHAVFPGHTTTKGEFLRHLATHV